MRSVFLIEVADKVVNWTNLGVTFKLLGPREMLAVKSMNDFLNFVTEFELKNVYLGLGSGFDGVTGDDGGLRSLIIAKNVARN